MVGKPGKSVCACVCVKQQAAMTQDKGSSATVTERLKKQIPNGNASRWICSAHKVNRIPSLSPGIYAGATAFLYSAARQEERVESC